MGLSYDANETVRIPSAKQEMLEEAKRKVAGNEDPSGDVNEDVEVIAAKSYVAEKLEEEAKAPRKRFLKLPKGQAQFLIYLIKKYGEDYEVRFSASRIVTVSKKGLIIFRILSAGNVEGQEESFSINLEANTSQDKNVQGNPGTV